MRRIAAPLLVLAAHFAIAAAPAGASREAYTEVPTVSPAWTARFEQEVRWHQVTPMGQLVVATDCCLYGVDPASGKVAWSLDGLASLGEDSFEAVPGTPLFVVGAGGLGNRTLIVDATNGHTVFDSSAAGIATILHRTVLFESGGLLVLGQERGDPTIQLFLCDMATGKIRWKQDDVMGDMSDGMKKVAGLLAQLAQAARPAGAASAERPLEVGADAVVLATSGKLHEIATKSGEFLWRVPNRDGGGRAHLFAVPQREDLILVATEVEGQGTSTNGEAPVETRYAAYRLDDGAAVWPKSVKVKGPLNPPVLLEGGAILSPGGSGSGNVKYVDYATGESRWGKNGKGLDTDGGIVDHVATPLGLVVTLGHDSAWSNKGTVYSLNVLDVAAGGFRFAKSFKVRGRILRTEVLPKGVLYVTTHEVNIFDPASGTSLLGTPVVSESLVTADAGNVLYAFAPQAGALWRVDKQRAQAVRLGDEPVELAEHDTPRALEVRGDRVTLLGSQHVIGFDPQGKVAFRSYYPAPRQPGWARALLVAQSVRAGMAAAEAGAAGAAMAQFASTREDGTLEREVGEELALGYTRLAEGAAGISAEYARMARQRFRASAASPDFLFVMVQLERGYGIAQVDKDDGAIRGLIPIGKDKLPAYQVDDVARRVYYRPDVHEILGYAF
jgi:hypothetical protein